MDAVPPEDFSGIDLASIVARGDQAMADSLSLGPQLREALEQHLVTLERTDGVFRKLVTLARRAPTDSLSA